MFILMPSRDMGVDWWDYQTIAFIFTYSVVVAVHGSPTESVAGRHRVLR